MFGPGPQLFHDNRTYLRHFQSSWRRDFIYHISSLNSPCGTVIDKGFHLCTALGLPTICTTRHSMPSTITICNSRKEGGSTVRNASNFNGGDIHLDIIHGDSDFTMAKCCFHALGTKLLAYTRERSGLKCHYGLWPGVR